MSSFESKTTAARARADPSSRFSLERDGRAGAKAIALQATRGVRRSLRRRLGAGGARGERCFNIRRVEESGREGERETESEGEREKEKERNRENPSCPAALFQSRAATAGPRAALLPAQRSALAAAPPRGGLSREGHDVSARDARGQSREGRGVIRVGGEGAGVPGSPAPRASNRPGGGGVRRADSEMSRSPHPISKTGPAAEESGAHGPTRRSVAVLTPSPGRSLHLISNRPGDSRPDIRVGAPARAGPRDRLPATYPDPPLRAKPGMTRRPITPLERR